MEKSIRLVDRDMKLLQDLFRYRTLTINQIRQLYFEAHDESYVYKRLGRLQQHHYVLVRSRFIANNKVGIVSISERGIRTLVQKKLISEDEVVRANHLRKLNTDYHLKNSLDARTLYVRLRGDGWEFKDGREFKIEKNLNRGNKVLGVLISPDGIEYPLFIMDRNFKDRTIAKVMTEIKTSPFSRALIMYRGTGTEDYQRIVAAHARAVEEQRLVANIHVFPFVMQSIDLLKKTLAPSCLVKYFTEEYGQLIPVKNRYYLAPYEIEHEGEQKMVMEYLSHDLYRTFSLELYGESAYREHQKKCLVFTWDAYQSEVESYLKGKPHMQLVTLNLETDIVKIPSYKNTASFENMNDHSLVSGEELIY